jgi:GAF domain-containing protein
MDDGRRLVDALAEIATLAAEPFDVELLHVAAARVRDVLGADGVSMFVSIDGTGRAWAMPALGIEGLELVLERPDSPCHTVLRTGEPIACSADDEPSVEGAHELLAELGIRSAAAVPLRHRDDTIGVLLLASRHGRLRSTTITDAQCFADVITAGLVREHAHRLQQAENQQLQHALDARIIVEQAKGMVAAELGIGVDAALDALRQFARSHHLKLHDVAADVVARTLPVANLRVPE